MEGVDFVVVYWMGLVIVYVFVSFVFVGDEYFVVFIEICKEKGEDYFIIKGFFC